MEYDERSVFSMHCCSPFMAHHEKTIVMLFNTVVACPIYNGSR